MATNSNAKGILLRFSNTLYSYLLNIYTGTIRSIPLLAWPIIFISWIPVINMDLILAVEFFSVNTPAIETVRSFINTFPVLKDPISLIFLALIIISLFLGKKISILPAIIAISPLVLQVIIVHFFHGFDGNFNLERGFPLAIAFLMILIGLTWSSMLIFAIVGSITETPFGLFFLILIIDSLLNFLGSNFTFFGLIFERYIPSFAGISLTLMAIFLIRSAFLLVQQNKGAYTRYSNHLLPSMGIGFLKWLPMLLFFILMSTLYSKINTNYVTPCVVTYIQKFDQWEAAWLAGTKTPECSPDLTVTVTIPLQTGSSSEEEATETKQIAPSIQQALDVLIDQKISELQTVIPEVSTAIRDTAVTTVSGASSSGVSKIETALSGRLPGTETRSCGFFDVGCYISNGIKSMMNSAYQKHKNAAVAGMHRDADKIDDATRQNADALTTQANNIATEHVNALQIISKRSIKRVASAASLVSVVFLAYSLLILAKSYLVVFARVLYSRFPIEPLSELDDHKTSKENAPRGKPLATNGVQNVSDTYTITDKEIREKIYAKSEVIGINIVERKRFPQPFRLPLRRLLSGAYMLCEIDPQQQSSCTLKVDSPAELVAWHLKDGEEIVFGLSDFAAMSDSIQLGSRIKLGLSSLIFGRIIYHTATGPGTLVLRTKSKSISGSSDDAAQTLNAAGLVAWGPSNEFKVDSSPALIDTYLSGSCLRKASKDLIVYDTSQARRKAGPLGGILKFARTFLVPI